MIANTITSVPIAIEKLRTSSRKIIPSPTANSGAVEVRVDERVGPRNFNPARAKFAETAGLNKPTKQILVLRVQEDTLSLKRMAILKDIASQMLRWLLLHHFESPYAPILDFEIEPLKQKEMPIKGIKEQGKRNQTLWRRYDFFWDITTRVMDVHQKI